MISMNNVNGLLRYDYIHLYETGGASHVVLSTRWVLCLFLREKRVDTPLSCRCLVVWYIYITTRHLLDNPLSTCLYLYL